MRHIFMISVILLSLPLLAQQEDSVFIQVDSVPRFPGGDYEMYDHVARHLTLRAPSYKLDNIQRTGYTALVNFIVTKEGQVIDFEHDLMTLEARKPAAGNEYDMPVFTGSGSSYLIDELEAVFENMPQWKPGYVDGEPVDTRLYVFLNMDYFGGALQIEYRPIYPDSVIYSQMKKPKYTLRQVAAILGVIAGIAALILLSNRLNGF